MRFFRLLPLLAVVLAACPKRGTTRAAGGPTVTIFVTGSLDAAALPVQAAVVRKARAQGPSLWLAVGDAQVDERWRELTDGEAVVRLLDAAGVDALLMGPEWLRFGPERCRELVDMARCHLLCANVSDTLRSVIGREFMVRRFEQVVVAVSAVWLDSTALEFRQAGVGFVAPEYAGARVGQVLRQRAGLTSLLAGPGLVQVRPEYDLTVAVDGDTAGGLLTPLAGPGRMARYRVTLLDGAVSDVVREDVPLDGVEPDPMVASVLGSLAGAVDSLAAVVVVESKVVVPPYSLGRVVARGLAAQSAADHVVYDTLAWDSILPGVITQGALCRSLRWAGRPALVELEGSEVRGLLKDRAVTVETRPALRSQRLASRRKYTVLVTTRLLAQRPELASRGFRPGVRPLWQEATAILRRVGGAR